MLLHAAVTVDGRDRKRLERVCRYLLRPPYSPIPAFPTSFRSTANRVGSFALALSMVLHGNSATPLTRRHGRVR